MRKILFSSLVCAAAWSSARAAAPSKSPAESLVVRAVAWDSSWNPKTRTEWNARAAGEISSAVKDGADVIVFPEGCSKEEIGYAALIELKDAAAGRLVVLGNTPFRERDGSVMSRAFILADDAWQAMDKIDPAAAERAQKPPVKAGTRMLLFRYRRGVVAALPAGSVCKPEFAASLKKRALQLLIVTAPLEDEAGAARAARCASSRAVEIGAAVVVAPPSPAAPVLYLPAQKGFDLKPVAPAGRDFRLPWKKLLDLRAGLSTEASPFLEPAPAYQTEI